MHPTYQKSVCALVLLQMYEAKSLDFLPATASKLISSLALTLTNLSHQFIHKKTKQKKLLTAG